MTSEPSSSAPETPAAEPTRGTTPPGRLAAVMAATSGSSAELTPANVAARSKAIPRVWDALSQAAFDDIREKLKGAVTDAETEDILGTLRSTKTPGHFLAIIDKLRDTEWKGDKSLLEKLMRRGVQDANEYIVDFAEIAGRNLGFNLDPGHGWDRRARAREVRELGKHVLAYFDCDNKRDFIEGLGHDVKNTFATAGAILLMALPGGPR